MTHTENNVRSHPSRNRGAALLLLLFLVVIVFSTGLVTSLLGGNLELQRQQKTFEALEQAKQALIAWSVMQGDVGTGATPRPGSLPCPETTSFGKSDTGMPAGTCSSGGSNSGQSIGRLPWRYIHSSRLQDASGETLWYAVSDNFRTPNLNNDAINSDTKGSLLLYASDGSTLLTPEGEELAAIIFAPGPPLSWQDRGAAANTASDYLDKFNEKDNSKAAGPFFIGTVKDKDENVIANDLVIGITARELISALEKRALNEARNALKSYFDNHGQYPNPAPHDDPQCASLVDDVNPKNTSIPSCKSVSGTCFGRLPENDLVLPAWFLQNAWGRVMTYAIYDASAGCPIPLKIGGEAKRYVLIAPGTARSGQSRPSTLLEDYLEDTDNKDTWSADPNFTVPSANSNDQLRSIP